MACIHTILIDVQLKRSKSKFYPLNAHPDTGFAQRRFPHDRGDANYDQDYRRVAPRDAAAKCRPAPPF